MRRRVGNEKQGLGLGLGDDVPMRLEEDRCPLLVFGASSYLFIYLFQFEWAMSDVKCLMSGFA